MRKLRIGTLIIAIMVPLIIGCISAVLSAKGMNIYGNMQKPPLSPPAWAFSVAWSILYVMMGVASYFVIVAGADSRSKSMAILIYAIQLAMNFMWSIIFFNWGLYMFAFIWLMVMWLLVILCTVKFFGLNRTAGWLMIPYVLWLTFAAYLNLGAWYLNKPAV